MLRIVSVGRPRLPPVIDTPIVKTDANTRAVFVDDISIYDIQRGRGQGHGADLSRERHLAYTNLTKYGVESEVGFWRAEALEYFGRASFASL